MPITSGAKKALRASRRKRVFNLRRQSVLKEAVKAYRAKPDTAGLNKVFKALDKASKRGVIKKGNADRRKSRLARLLVSK